MANSAIELAIPDPQVAKRVLAKVMDDPAVMREITEGVLAARA